VSRSKRERNTRLYKEKQVFNMTKVKQKITRDNAGLSREHQETANSGHPAESVVAKNGERLAGCQWLMAIILATW
jgi:hypothetical protein